jgi:hypothetical protein
MDLCVTVSNEGAGQKSNISNLLAEFCAFLFAAITVQGSQKKWAHKNDESF